MDPPQAAIGLAGSQATVVAADAVQAPKATFYATLFDSPAFLAQMRAQQSQMRRADTAVTPTLMDRIRSTLPRWSDAGNQLRFGRHITVSAEGDEAIELVRKMALATSLQAREQALTRLQTMVRNRCPEALNAYGFLLETGRFGARVDLPKAMQYYQAAARSGYQPALYNLGLMAAYGKTSQPDPAAALQLVAQAQTLGPEASSRVCGMASFLAFRQGDARASAGYSKGCGSALTHLSRSTADSSAETLPQRVQLLRDFLATGANDGFALLVDITKAHADQDPGQLYCKYLLVNRFQGQHDLRPLKALAERCVIGRQTLGDAAAQHPPEQLQQLAGVLSFVPAELSRIQAMRQSNRFHYAWPVPYLPFAQQEVDIFAPKRGQATP